MSDDGLRLWTPTPGELTDRLLSRQHELSDEARAEHLGAAIRTLSRCASPSGAGRQAKAHLIVGEVQSGKTLAFTTLMALAHDAGFRLIIVLAGTKLNLMDQTVQRLRHDLMRGDGGINPWRRLENPSLADERELLGLGQHGSSTTMVCFVLKDVRRLAALAQVLAAVGEKVDLAEVPALIVDDEADQASPNRKVRLGEESAIYAAIGKLRQALPRHDFLMYTATPQAPLLIQLDDALSPATVAVLRSGAGYVGGSDLFIERADDYVRLIPPDDVVVATDPDALEPPPSLRRAVATFLLALTIAQERGHPKPLSMLVHPAVTRDVHGRHHQWVSSIVDGLVTPLRAPEDVAFGDALRGDLGAAYTDLATTCPDVPPLESLARKLPSYAAAIDIRTVNQDAVAEIGVDDWDDSAGWIVIGGAKLDRGFTVKNLAITYMPRGRGVGNADTIQQRGRFFGYKRNYLDLCRGWFSAETAEAFRGYVGHEQALLRSLRELETSSLPLHAWRRQLLLSPDLKPTRREVISLEATRKRIFAADGWCEQRLLMDAEAAASNRAVLQRLLDDVHGEQSHPDDPRPSPHLLAELSIVDALSALDDWTTIGSDRDRFLGAALVLGILRDQGQADRVHMLLMDGHRSLTESRYARERRPRADDPQQRINIFQGRGSGSSAGYPGDRAFRADDRPTLALFGLNLRASDPTLSDVVPAMAVHVPQPALGLLVEDERHADR